ncbi:MAG: hypothetical protein LBN25_03940, partial [Christensenellaceae bacterium]|nr:hypothetical protein [Christensenellaceae bacterium]
LEAAALISSYWGEDLIPETEDAAKSGSNARRKYYKITEKGMNYYFQKRDEWRIVSEIINKLILS